MPRRVHSTCCFGRSSTATTTCASTASSTGSWCCARCRGSAANRNKMENKILESKRNNEIDVCVLLMSVVNSGLGWLARSVYRRPRITINRLCSPSNPHSHSRNHSHNSIQAYKHSKDSCAFCMPHNRWPHPKFPRFGSVVMYLVDSLRWVYVVHTTCTQNWTKRPNRAWSNGCGNGLARVAKTVPVRFRVRTNQLPR